MCSVVVPRNIVPKRSLEQLERSVNSPPFYIALTHHKLVGPTMYYYCEVGVGLNDYGDVKIGTVAVRYSKLRELKERLERTMKGEMERLPTFPKKRWFGSPLMVAQERIPMLTLWLSRLNTVKWITHDEMFRRMFMDW